MSKWPGGMRRLRDSRGLSVVLPIPTGDNVHSDEISQKYLDLIRDVSCNIGIAGRMHGDGGTV